MYVMQLQCSQARMGKKIIIILKKPFTFQITNDIQTDGRSVQRLWWWENDVENQLSHIFVIIFTGGAAVVVCDCLS